MGLNTLVAQPISTLKAKLWKIAMKYKNVMFFNFWAFFLKMYILMLQRFILPITYPVTHFFQW